MEEHQEQGKQGKKVCVVDDNDDIRDIYGTKFRREGFTVVTAGDGEEALAVIRKERPDVILLDIQMPILDGLGVLKVLKSDGDLAKIPVVILSNVDNEDMFQQVSELGGAQYYLVKSLTDPQKVVDVTLKALAER
ncbi:MAG: response regulator [Candidatus Moraniibacteriota bacterium]